MPENIRKVIAVPTAGIVTKVGINVPMILPIVLKAPNVPTVFPLSFKLSTVMALGNIWGGRSADKDPNPDKLYMRLLIAALWIAAIPVINNTYSSKYFPSYSPILYCGLHYFR